MRSSLRNAISHLLLVPVVEQTELDEIINTSYESEGRTFQIYFCLKNRLSTSSFGWIEALLGSLLIVLSLAVRLENGYLSCRRLLFFCQNRTAMRTPYPGQPRVQTSQSINNHSQLALCTPGLWATFWQNGLHPEAATLYLGLKRLLGNIL